MNLSEFKAWFEGFTEDMKGTPSEKAWKRIKQRVSEITEKPTEIRYFYDHYWRPYYSAFPYSFILCGGVGQATGASYTIQNLAKNSSHTTAISNNPRLTAAESGPMYSLTSSEAFQVLGRADAATL